MTPAVLVLLLKLNSAYGQTAVTIEMPDMKTCLIAAHSPDKVIASAFCVDRQRAWDEKACAAIRAAGKECE